MKGLVVEPLFQILLYVHHIPTLMCFADKVMQISLWGTALEKMTHRPVTETEVAK